MATGSVATDGGQREIKFPIVEKEYVETWTAGSASGGKLYVLIDIQVFLDKNCISASDFEKAEMQYNPFGRGKIEFIGRGVFRFWKWYLGHDCLVDEDGWAETTAENVRNNIK